MCLNIGDMNADRLLSGNTGIILRPTLFRKEVGLE